MNQIIINLSSEPFLPTVNSTKEAEAEALLEDGRVLPNWIYA